MADVSGTVYVDEGVTPMGVGRTLNYSVNGAASSGSTTTAADGTYTISGVSNNNPFAVYLQGNAEAGVAICTSNANGNIAGIDIYQDGLVVHNGSAGAMTAANVATTDNNGATGLSNVYASASSIALTLAAGKSLYVRAGATASLPATTTVPGSVINRGTATFASLVLTGSGTILCNNWSLTSALTVNASGTYTLADALRANAITMTAGTLDVSASNFGITCTAGQWGATAGVFVCRQGTVTLSHNNGTARTISGSAGPFYHLVKEGSVATLTVSNAVTVGGNLTISTGTFDLNGQTLNVAGNFTNNSTFTASAGTVVLNGAGGSTQTISGDTTFHTLTATAAAARAITFTDGTTTTVTNAVTFTGSSGQLLTLGGSSTAGWTIAMPATQTLGYLSVSYSTATGNTAAAGATSTDGLNNTNWTFSAAAASGFVGRVGGGRFRGRVGRRR
jgi:fibronectin-binding autotransporter adhesin